MAGMCLASTSEAALVSRLGGLAVYDTDFNITWLADANANGYINWQTAKDWAAGLNVGGYTGWRLPTALNPDLTGPCYGFNCTDSELGHLYYTELGVTQGRDITSSTSPYLALFTNVQNNFYWSSTEYAPDPNSAWDFSTFTGPQHYNPKNTGSNAWAVRTGDVASTSVPEPGIIWLLLAGGLGWYSQTAARVSRQGGNPLPPSSRPDGH